MVSIKDIALECGVSPATVSKALHDHDDVSSATKQRVKAAAKRLGYLPNAMAQALKTNRTYNIGVLMADQANNGLRHHYFAAILDHFKICMERSGYDLTFISNQIGEKTCSYYEHCMYRNVDGVLAACVDFETPEIQRLLESDLPIVSIDYISENSAHTEKRYAVVSDNASGIRDAVNFAVRNGHSKIAYLCGEHTQVTQKRVETFCEVLAEHLLGQPCIRQARYLHPELAYHLTEELLSEKNHPTCILYPDDICATAGIEAIHKKGLRVGKDVSVIGYDGHPLLQMFSPKLTTIRQDTESIGQKAAELMLQLLRKEEIPQESRVYYCKGVLLEGETVGLLSQTDSNAI